MFRVNELLAAALVGAAAFGPGALAAENADPVSLFRFVSVRDEVTVGFTREELEPLGNRPAIDLVADQLARKGYVIAWQYNVGRGADGSVRQMAQRRIAIYAPPLVRIEPVKSEQPIDPPKP